jgi:hypothetical protein
VMERKVSICMDALLLAFPAATEDKAGD